MARGDDVRELAVRLRGLDDEELAAVVRSRPVTQAIPVTSFEGLAGLLSEAWTVTQALAPLDRFTLQVVALLAQAGERATRTGLLQQVGVGSSPDAATVAEVDGALARLAAAGLAFCDGDDVWLPSAVRGRRLPDLGPLEPRPPALPVVAEDAVDDDAGGARVAGLAQQMEEVLAAAADTPLAQVLDGGVAVKDVRRVAKRVGVTPGEAAALVQLAADAGLLAPAPPPDRTRRRPDDRPPDVVPTSAAGPADVPTRAGRLTAAWLGLPLSLGSLEVAPPSQMRPLGHWRVADDAAPLRRDLLVAAGGQAVPVAALLDATRWHRPLRGDPDELAREEVAEDLARLGLSARGVLTAAGRAVSRVLARPDAAPDDAAAAVRDAWRDVLPAPVDVVTLVPDLTAVVLGTPTPDLAALLDGAADLEPGGASVWRFSRASVRRVLDRGTSAEDLLAALGQVAPRGVPGTLASLVADVARGHGRLRVGEASCYLRCDDEALVAQVLRDRKLAALGLRQVVPTLLVGSVPAARAVTALRTAGYLPLQEGADLVPVLQRPPPGPAAPPLRWPSLGRSEGFDGWRLQEPVSVVRRLRTADLKGPARPAVQPSLPPWWGGLVDPPAPVAPGADGPDADAVLADLRVAARHLGPEDVDNLAHCLVEGCPALLVMDDDTSLIAEPLVLMDDQLWVMDEAAGTESMLSLRSVRVVGHA